MTPTKTDPIHPKTLADMSEDELDTHIEAKREHRLAAWHIHKEMTELIREKKEDRLTKMIAKQVDMLDKEGERVDKLLDKLDARVLKLRGLKLELTGLV